jgi:Nucleotide-diphospho-sugar transferase
MLRSTSLRVVTMARSYAQSRFVAHCFRIVVILGLLWHNIRLLVSILPESDVFSGQIPVNRRFITRLMNEQQNASSAIARLIQETVESNIFDLSNKIDWPPMDLLDAIFADSNSAFVFSTAGLHPNVPRLVATTVTSGEVPLADNFANSLLSINVTNFVLVPLDAEAYGNLTESYPMHTLPLFPTLDEPHDIHAARQPIIISAFLQRGIAVFFNDATVVWQHNAWHDIDQQYVTAESALNIPEIMFWNDEPFQICECMIYALPTINSLHVMDLWEADIRFQEPPYDQTLLTQLLQYLQQPRFLEQMIAMKIWSNDIKFPSGKGYSWDVATPENQEAVAIHNNWIVGGVDEKRERFQKAGLWHPSREYRA